MEQGLYAQVVKLRRKDLKSIAVNKNKKEAKFKFQGQYARSQCWYNIDFGQIEKKIAHLSLIYLKKNAEK